jgi:hypothetical protein
VIPFVTPGPAVSTASPGIRVELAHRLGGEDGGLLMAGIDQADGAPALGRPRIARGGAASLPPTAAS